MKYCPLSNLCIREALTQPQGAKNPKTQVNNWVMIFSFLKRISPPLIKSWIIDKMLIDCISDLHGFKPELSGGDLLIICGDLTARDKRDEYDQFNLWLSHLSYHCKVVIGGNHDGLLERKRVTISHENVHYLCDSGFEFDGLKIWGSPYTPKFENWHFMENRGQDIRRHWNLIPNDTDILVTHGPPYGIFDEVDDDVHVGCKELKVAVQERIRPRIHCFGHIHEGGGKVVTINNTTYVNCSYVDERYRPVNSAIRLEIRSDKTLV